MSGLFSLLSKKSPGIWRLRQDYPLSAETNMETDAEALQKVITGEITQPIIRLFEWSEIAISFGYLMKEEQVREWACALKNAPIVKRPTGGGAVLHYPHDLSVSLLWPRGKDFFPDQPRAAYEKIHSILMEGMTEFLGEKKLSLYVKPKGRYDEPVNPSPFPWKDVAVRVCFKEPVCHDVMLEEKKIVGGALRITRNAMLYQGNIQMEEKFDTPLLKTVLAKTFRKHLSIAK